jgi:hypothetical protein
MLPPVKDHNQLRPTGEPKCRKEHVVGSEEDAKATSTFTTKQFHMLHVDTVKWLKYCQDGVKL